MPFADPWLTLAACGSIHALYASPISLLAWIGEKFIDWTDQTPSLDTILDAVTLWYLTDTFPYSIYMYRAPGSHILSCCRPSLMVS